MSWDSKAIPSREVSPTGSRPSMKPKSSTAVRNVPPVLASPRWTAERDGVEGGRTGLPVQPDRAIATPTHTVSAFARGRTPLPLYEVETLARCAGNEQDSGRGPLAAPDVPIRAPPDRAGSGVRGSGGGGLGAVRIGERDRAPPGRAERPGSSGRPAHGRMAAGFRGRDRPRPPREAAR